MDLYDTEDYLDVFIIRFQPKTILTRARTIANIIAVKNPSIQKPGIIFATRSTIKTLIISEKRPRVITLSGSVRIFKNGPIVLFTIASVIATTIAVKYPSTTTPGIIYAAIATANADITKFNTIFIY